MHPEKKQNQIQQPPQPTKKTPKPPTMFHFTQVGKKKIKQIFILETVSIKILFHNLILVGRWQGKKKGIRRCVLIKNDGSFFMVL